MGQSVVIAGPHDWNIQTFERMISRMKFRVTVKLVRAENSIQAVGGEHGWLLDVAEYPAYQAAGVSEYASNDMLDPRFRGDVQGLKLFDVRFKDFEAVRNLVRLAALEATSSGSSMWMDTDYGWVISAAELLQKMRDDPGWDWRHVVEE